MNRIIQANDGQPPTGSPKIKVLAIITQIKIKAIKQEASPNINAISSGAVEKAMIP